MAAHRKYTLPASMALVVLVGLRSEAHGREVQISGPGGESASQHTAPQVQVWSCNGKLHNCRVSQSGTAQKDKYLDREGHIVMPKFKSRKVRRAPGRR